MEVQGANRSKSPCGDFGQYQNSVRTHGAKLRLSRLIYYTPGVPYRYVLEGHHGRVESTWELPKADGVSNPK